MKNFSKKKGSVSKNKIKSSKFRKVCLLSKAIKKLYIRVNNNF